MSINAIQDALNRLDPTNENHWTADGLPKVETVRFLAGDQNITREQIQKTDPQFTRLIAAQRLEGQGISQEQPTEQTQPIQDVAQPVVTDSTMLDAEDSGDSASGPQGDDSLSLELPNLGTEVPTDQVISELHSKINEMREARLKLDAMIDSTQAEIDRLEEIRYRAQNNGARENPVMDYLAARQRQQEQRAEELSKATAVRQASALDRSFAMKRQQP